MGFLGNAKESPTIVFAEFHIEVLPFDLDLLRFDNIVHVRAESDRRATFGKQKIRLNFATKRSFKAGSAPAFAVRSTVVGGKIGYREVNLSLELVYPRHVHTQFIAYGKAAAPLPSHKTALPR